MKHFSCIIIGSGPAGLTAAIYLSRAQITPLVIAGPEPGGQLTTTTEVENFPGFEKGIPGPELMQVMRKQAERFGSQFVQDSVTQVDFSQKPFTITTPSETYSAECVIIATGASAKWLGLESEQRLRGKGVSACATCDGFFFRGKDIAVVGGGDTAMEEATFLTTFAKSVTVIHRNDSLAASAFMQEKAKSNPKISFVMNSEITEVMGDQAVTGIKVKNKQTAAEQIIPVQGVFVAIGHKPNTDFLEGHVELTKGYVKNSDMTHTSVDGVFVAGDVHDWRYRQAVTAAGFGCMAALDAEKYLSAKE